MHPERSNYFYGVLAFKAIIFYIAGFYLFGFSLNGVNVNGAVDFLIPYEQLMCFCLSLVFFGWFIACCRGIIVPAFTQRH